HDRTPGQWFIAGLLGGLASITHVQEALFLALIPAEAVYEVLHRTWTPRRLSGYGLLAAGVVLPVVPQLVVDQVIFQQWLPRPAPNISLDFGPSAPPRPAGLDASRLAELEPDRGARIARATSGRSPARMVRIRPAARRHRRVLDQRVAVGLVGR